MIENRSKKQYTKEEFEKLLSDHNIPVNSAQGYEGGYKWTFNAVPLPCQEDGHGPGACCIILTKHGWATAVCLNASCQNLTWSTICDSYDIEEKVTFGTGRRSKITAYDLGKEYIQSTQDNYPVPTIVYAQKRYFQFNGSIYVQLERDSLASNLFDFAEKRGYIVNPTTIDSAIGIIDLACHESSSKSIHLRKGSNHSIAEPHKRLLPFDNGFLDLVDSISNPSPVMIKPTPEIFCSEVNSNVFNKDNLACPRWQQFLQETWPDDPGSIELLQRWFGLLLTSETKYQKFLYLLVKRVRERPLLNAFCAKWSEKRDPQPTRWNTFKRNLSLGSPTFLENTW